MISTGGEGGTDDAPATVEVRRRHRWRRISAIAALSALLVLLVALAGVWIARRPIASNLLENEFRDRGVQATYELERVGLRTQQVRNLVIGDPKDPDLVARYALIQLRIKWDGSIEVYRVVARGVRLEGQVVEGRVSWGQLDRLLPPPTDKPFEFPNMVVDVADTSISLRTPAGPLGFAVRGTGNLSGGFKGHLATASPALDFGTCRLTTLDALVAIQITARRPHVQGPVAAQRFACPASSFLIDQARFDIDTRFNESFTRYNGSGRMAAQRLIAGANGMAAMTGKVSFRGRPKNTIGTVEVAARQSRLGPVYAERTRVEGRYALSASAGTLALVGDYSVQDSRLAPSVLAGVTEPLAGASNTPIGPIAAALRNAIGSAASSFDATGEIRVVNGPGGGAARIESADVRTDRGARARVSGGDGVTYYWPSGRLRIDGLIEMAGGGLPTAQVLLRQPRGGGPMSGVARIAPYQVGDSRLALDPIVFRATASGATSFTTVAVLDGRIPNGRVRGLRLPIDGRIQPNGSLSVGQSCMVVSFAQFQVKDIQLGPTRLPVCPIGPAIIAQGPSGSLKVNARIDQPRLVGRLGQTPMRLNASSARIVGTSDFTLTNMALRLGNPASPIALDADRLQGSFRGSGTGGTFSNADATIANVPLLMTNADGRWRFRGGDLLINGAVTVQDRDPNPRFYPLRSNDFAFTLSGDDIRAGGTLVHPESGTRVTDVSIRHDLQTGAGGAVLDVPGLAFGANLQPEDLTRMTEGVVALVQGTVRGQGRINWDTQGEVTSSGEFSTVNMDLAAPFGPVEGLTTTVRFTDLLALETAPGQVATVRSINPGIPVENGAITYQLLRNQRVRVQRGVWPFMGGTLILHETVLDFSRPTAKRLTFEVVGFNAMVFINSLGFEGIEITGIFDGVLPLIFDDAGGRVVGGRLESRPPGGEFRYTGTKPDAGLVAGVAFDLLSNIRYGSMIVRLDGYLDAEFASRFAISNVTLGSEGGFIAGMVRRAFRNVPLKVNLNIKGPFRALIQMAKGFEDPTVVIEPVMPFPLDAPGIVTETRTLKKEEGQARTTPADEVTATPQPLQPSER